MLVWTPCWAQSTPNITASLPSLPPPRGVAKVVLIDQVGYRLEHAARHLPGLQTLNFSEHKDVVAELQRLIPQGPDVAIEAVCFHYAKGLMHQVGCYGGAGAGGAGGAAGGPIFY